MSLRGTKGHFHGHGNSGLNPAMRLTVEGSRGPYTIQAVLETGEDNLVMHDTSWGKEEK